MLHFAHIYWVCDESICGTFSNLIFFFKFIFAEECEAKIGYVQCDRCTEAVHKDLLEIHKQEDYCTEKKANHLKCPLCHEQIEGPLNGGWKNHLTNQNGCSGTAKRRARV